MPNVRIPRAVYLNFDAATTENGQIDYDCVIVSRLPTGSQDVPFLKLCDIDTCLCQESLGPNKSDRSTVILTIEPITCLAMGAITAMISISYFGESWLAMFLGWLPGLFLGVFLCSYFDKSRKGLACADKS